jgi:hypothetical protein
MQRCPQYNANQEINFFLFQRYTKINSEFLQNKINPNKATIQSTYSWKKSLQDRLGKTEQKRVEITKKGDQRSCFQGNRVL